MKRGLSILVLCIFLAHFAGFYIYFALQLKLVRTEMRAQLKSLPDNQLESIRLSVTDFKKALVEEYEIRVEGKMYDIARLVSSADSVQVFCVHDAAEDNLLAFLDKILSLPLKDKHAPAQVLKFTFLTFIVPGILNNPCIKLETHVLQTGYLDSISTFIKLPDFPPPRL